MTTPVSGRPDDNPAVPSHAALFEDPADTPPVLSPNPVDEGGRLYRSSGAVGELAESAIPALTIDLPIDADLPISPEVVAAEIATQSSVIAVESEPVIDQHVTGQPEATADALVEPDLPLLEPPSAAIVAIPAVDVDEAPSEEPAAVEHALVEPVVRASEDFTSIDPIAPIALRSEPALPLHGDEQPADSDAPIPMNVALAASTTVVADDSPSLNDRILSVIPPEQDGLTWSRAALIMVVGTVVAAFVEALLRHSIGSLTGIVLVILTILCALRLRRDDIWAAVIMPPLAFLAAVVSAGQLTMNRSGSFVSRQLLNIVTVLALNAPWILGATIVGLVLVLIRIYILGRHHDESENQATDVAASA